MGDFGDLCCLVDFVVDVGVYFVGVNLLYVLFLYDLEWVSLYSLFSCEWLNVFYFDVEVVCDFGECFVVCEWVGFEIFV